MSHIGTIKYSWSWDNLPGDKLEFWDDHFKFLDPAADGLPVEIEYAFTSGYPAKTDGPPERCYPGEPDEVEILSMVATVPYSSDGAKAEHLDAYPNTCPDALTCHSQNEFCNLLLGAWEAWAESKEGKKALDEWLLEKAVEIEADLATETMLAMLEAREESKYQDF